MGSAGIRQAITRLRNKGLKHLPEKAKAALDRRLRHQIQAKAAAGLERGFFPVQLAIETTAFCNARCTMCPNTTMKRPKGVMSNEAHRLIVEKVAEWNAPIQTITHAGLGEPLTDKRLEDKVKYERFLFKTADITIYTNASLLTEERAAALVASGVTRFSVSMNAHRKETYEQIMGLSFENTLNHIASLLSLRRTERGLSVDISLIPTKDHSSDEISAFSEHWQDQVDNVIVPPLISWGGYYRCESEERQWPCRYIWQSLVVNWDGRCSMCCEDYENIYSPGNLITDAPQDIFNSQRMQRQRRLQSEGNFEWPSMCRDCMETRSVARDFWKTGLLMTQDGNA